MDRRKIEQLNKHFIDHSWIDGKSSEEITVIDKHDLEILGSIKLCSDEQIDKMLFATKIAQNESSNLSLEQRLEILARLKNEVQKHFDLFVDLISAEAAKPLDLAKAEVSRAINVIDQCAHSLFHFKGTEVVVDYAKGKGKKAFSQYYSKGIVFAISPYNYPLNLVMHKIAPAIAVGSSVLLAPSPHTPFTANLLVDLIQKISPLKNLVQVFHGSHKQVQKVLQDNNVKVLSFTGSDKVGWMLKSLVPKKTVLLELGGTAPTYVDKSANIEKAACELCASAYSYSGQVCISTQNILIHEDKYEAFVRIFKENMKNYKSQKLGLEGTKLSSLISKEHYINVYEKIQNLNFFQIYDDCKETNSMEAKLIEGLEFDNKVCSEEIFAPVCFTFKVKDENEALEKMNSSKFALQASLYTNDFNQFNNMSNNLEYGAILINHPPAFRVDGMPYGGNKESGVGREGPLYAMTEYCDQRLIIY